MTQDEIKDKLVALGKSAEDANSHGIAVDCYRALANYSANKPGLRTTEFWVSAACGAVGTALQFVPGREVIGAGLLAVATLAYNLSRGIAKKGDGI